MRVGRPLTPQTNTRYCVKEGTERPGTSPPLKEHRKGHFRLCGCELPAVRLGDNSSESGTGWPSFYQPIGGNVGKTEDRTTHAPHRGHCRRCGGHIGHVFATGPKRRIALQHRRVSGLSYTGGRTSATEPWVRLIPAMLPSQAIVPGHPTGPSIFKS